MGIYKLIKTYQFDAAHMLNGHNGKCYNLHGHTYHLDVIIEHNKLNKNGFIIDFYDLGLIVKPLIESLDHSMIIAAKAQSDKIIDLCDSENRKIYLIDVDETTCENMLPILYASIKKKLNKYVNTNNSYLRGYKLELTLWETPTGRVNYREED